MNQQVDMRQMQGMMAAYEKESAKMEMSAEMSTWKFHLIIFLSSLSSG